MSLEENKAIIRRALAALDRHDFGTLGDHPGLYQIVARQPMIRTSFPDLQKCIAIMTGDTDEHGIGCSEFCGNDVHQMRRTSGTPIAVVGFGRTFGAMLDSGGWFP